MKKRADELRRGDLVLVNGETWELAERVDPPWQRNDRAMVYVVLREPSTRRLGLTRAAKTLFEVVDP